MHLFLKTMYRRQLGGRHFFILVLLGTAESRQVYYKSSGHLDSVIVYFNVYGRMNKNLVPYLLGLYPHMSNLVNRDGSITFKALKAAYSLAETSL